MERKERGFHAVQRVIGRRGGEEVVVSFVMGEGEGNSKGRGVCCFCSRELGHRVEPWRDSFFFGSGTSCRSF